MTDKEKKEKQQVHSKLVFGSKSTDPPLKNLDELTVPYILKLLNNNNNEQESTRAPNGERDI